MHNPPAMGELTNQNKQTDTTDRFLVGGGIPEYLKPESSTRRKFLATAGIATAGVIIGLRCQ